MGIRDYIVSIQMIIFATTVAYAASATEPKLMLQFGEQHRELSRSQLLARKDVRQIALLEPNVHQDMTFTAVPVAALLIEFLGTLPEKDNMVVFKSLDGFAGFLDPLRALNQDSTRPMAFVAIEDPLKPWPTFKIASKETQLGPFYVIWTKPKGSTLYREEWPFQLAGFEIKPSLASTHPKLMPDAKLSANSPIRLGLKVFTESCFPCHRLNHEGLSEQGPDLNQPLSPTEYLKSDAILKKLIRNPQSLRHWSGSKMKGFSEKEITDTQIAHLIQYFKHMAQHRPPLNPDAH